jgi:methyl-accepting chemotaxis protein
MNSYWNFGRKIAAGFTLVVAFAVGIGIVATVALHGVVASKDEVISVNGPLLVAAQELKTLRERQAGTTRAYLLTGIPEDLATVEQARADFSDALEDLKNTALTAEGRRDLEAIWQVEHEYRKIVDQVFAMRQANASVDAITDAFTNQLVPKLRPITEAINAFVKRETQLLNEAQAASTDAASRAIFLIGGIAIVAALLAGLLAFFLASSLNRQIGAAVRHVQSSSAELQAAANQQATGVKEQVTSMNEINTTINELLATSRQIAESAQRVAQISERTTSAARSGDDTVERANESVSSIRRQVDLVVGHMLELGKKSQQIGAVLDIVTELAEQTNILSINATIEAAGAGETGKRFAVVADEIRKLADRVAGSAKEVRALIDDVRSSVNTTVMATETGSKAVDTGSRQFDDVATLFKQIATLVMTTTEAAREIELSTKQQATAVEQVNIAISNVAQATKETEASAGQTIQTATELATTSRNLLRLVQARSAA